MTSDVEVTRRAILRIGLGAVAAASGSAFAKSNADSGHGTPAQTAGPFYPKHDQADKDPDLTQIRGHSGRAKGEVVHVSGQVLGDDNKPIPGAFVDVWQANSLGRYAHEDDPNPAPLDPDFQGWGQIKADGSGHYRFKTIIPGPYPAEQNWMRPPHIHFRVSKRGFHEVTTQMYFADHPLNDIDRLLLELPASERQKLIVRFVRAGGENEPDARQGQFNIMLRRVRTS